MIKIIGYDLYKAVYKDHYMYSDWLDEYYCDIDEIVQTIVGIVQWHDCPYEDALDIINAIRTGNIKFYGTDKPLKFTTVDDVIESLHNKELVINFAEQILKKMEDDIESHFEEMGMWG